jgi:hypothetical protein
MTDSYGKINVNLGGYLSKTSSYSGETSVLLTSNSRFGLSSQYEYTDAIRYIKISVWRKDKTHSSKIVFEGNKESNAYYTANTAIETSLDGWEKIELKIEPPRILESFKIYVWSPQSDTAYFDDLQIEFYPEKIYPTYADEEKLHLYFSDAKINSFWGKINKAFQDGVHFSDGKWIKGIMSNERDVMPVKARLKGDWLDHMQGDKWSLRIKMRDDYVFERMKVFSIQDPETRFFIHEFVAHKLFKKADVLTTRYSFKPVYRNGVSKGIYAVEEHFAKQLIEFNLRREGPILKFDEDPFWRLNQHKILHGNWLNLPYFETSKVMAFGMGKTLEKPNLKNQFDIAQGLMYQYKEGNAPVDELFDLDALAKYWALIDISNGRHGLAWHNQRMYYNPVLCKLEPINFDNYTDKYKESRSALITALELKDRSVIAPEAVLYHFIFKSEKFLTKYRFFLNKYLNEAILEDIISENRNEIDKYESLIKQEFNLYSFDDEFLNKNAQLIRKKLSALDKEIEEGFFKKMEYQIKKKDADTQFLPKVIPHYLNAFYYMTGESQSELLLENYSGREIKAVGLADETDRLIYTFDNNISLLPFKGFAKDTVINTVYTPQATKFVFKINGHNDIFYTELAPWKKMTGKSPYQKLLHSFDFNTCDLYDFKGDSLIVSGNHIVDEIVLIPENKILVFEKGAQVDFVNRGGLISYSPVFMNGTKEEPIIIKSSDSTANAFTVLKAHLRSQIEYVTFTNLNTLDFEGWTLTGAVNFYESDVDIYHTQFLNNHCEDALNIIRSDFKVSEAKFRNIFADAFDSDFCTGLLDHSHFSNVGNDAIDFSTSQIHIEDCKMVDIGDKGVSGGEGSTLWVRNTSLSRCNIGAASKDLSQVELINVSIDSCKYALVALKKKPEYGAATLSTRDLKISNCETKHLIEDQSVLFLNGRKIEGYQKNVAKLFY